MRMLPVGYLTEDCSSLVDVGAAEKTRTSTGVTPQRPQRCIIQPNFSGTYMFFHGSSFICLHGMSTTQRHTMCTKILNVSVMCDGFFGIRKGNKIDRYRSRFSTPVADRYGTNYPPEFLYQAMVAQHQVQEWGDFD